MSCPAAESMSSFQYGGMDFPVSETVRRLAPNLTMHRLLLVSLVCGIPPLWLLLGYGEKTLSCNFDIGCAIELSTSWYKNIWNIVIEEVGIDSLKSCHNLHEADLADYAAGKNILVFDFLEFVEMEIDLERLFRCPFGKDCRNALHHK